jgi:electron transport complex protein RnfG
MKDIISIIFRLTLSCIVAGLIMGGTFIFTDRAKKANEHAREEKVMYSLLGHDEDGEDPESMVMHELFRYIVTDGEEQFIGYLLPLPTGFEFITIGLDGSFVSRVPVQLSETQVLESGERDTAIAAALGPTKTIRFADQTLVVTDDGERSAFLLSGKFPGYKTSIAIILALAPDFSIIGFEVMEHEEDPGLGADIERDFFRRQFENKSFESIKALRTIKEPLPQEYFDALEGRIAEEEAAAAIMEKYRLQDIYALTGATISTDAVVMGIKAMTKKFAYRIETLDAVLADQQIAASF